MYSVTDSNDPQGALVFEDMFDAVAKIDEISREAYVSLLPEYDCYIEYDGGTSVRIMGRERDRFGIYDRCLFVVWMGA